MTPKPSRSRTGLPARSPSPSHAYHPCSCSLTVSPHSVVSIPAKSPSHPSIPSTSPPTQFARCCGACTTGSRRRLGPRTCVLVYLSFESAGFHNTHIVSFHMSPVPILCSAVPPVIVLLMSCLYSKTRLCRNISSSSHRFFLDFACERVGGAQRAISIATFWPVVLSLTLWGRAV